MVARVLIIVIALAGCEKQSALYCGEHAEDIANCGYSDAGIDARPTCMAMEDCVGAAPYCELSSGVCVGCLDSSHCTDPNALYCDTSTYECKGCVSHVECGSEACLPNGVCGDDTNVAYVDAQASATSGCTLLDPCMLVSDALDTGRPYVKLASGTILEDVTVSAKTVTFLAEPDTVWSRANNGVVLSIASASTVAIYDLTLLGVNETALLVTSSTVRLVRTTLTGSNAASKPAVEAKSTSTLRMSRCLVHSNAGGGILTDSTTTYDIQNTFIYRNGTDAGSYGGATLLAANPGERRFELNTVADNRAKIATSAAGGVACTPGGPALVNNLIVRNYAGGSASNPGANQLPLGGCTSTGSEVATDASLYSFIDAEAATGPWNYHVGPGSMAIDRAGASDITIDYDGHIRPQGPRLDFGADEYKPN